MLKILNQILNLPSLFRNVKVNKHAFKNIAELIR